MDEIKNKSKIKDLTGKRFGRLVVEEYTDEREYHSVVWKCRCDCGTVIMANGERLRNGSLKSCGCLRKERTGRMNTKDLVGQRFGRLVVVKPTEKRANTFVVWECRCDCGNTTYVNSNHLTKGRVRSCGCLKKENMKNLKLQNLEGLRFGRLVAVKPTDKRSYGYIVWECLCDCGNTAYVRSSSLVDGLTNSCGCLKKESKEKRREKES